MNRPQVTIVIDEVELLEGRGEEIGKAVLEAIGEYYLYEIEGELWENIAAMEKRLRELKSVEVMKKEKNVALGAGKSGSVKLKLRTKEEKRGKAIEWLRERVRRNPDMAGLTVKEALKAMSSGDREVAIELLSERIKFLREIAGIGAVEVPVRGASVQMEGREGVKEVKLSINKSLFKNVDRG